MAPRQVTKRPDEPIKGKHFKGTSESNGLTSTPRTLRSRQLRSSVTIANKASAADATGSHPHSPPPKPFTGPRTRSPKQKNTIECKHSQKRPGKDSPVTLLPTAAPKKLVSALGDKRTKKSDDHQEERSKKRDQDVPKLQLSVANLKTLQGQLETPSDMAIVPEPRGRKRRATPMPRESSSNSAQSSTSRSPASNGTLGAYRFATLRHARIFVHPEPPSPEIQSRLKKVFDHEISDDRKTEIFGIGENMSKDIIEKLEIAVREDDLLELVIEALKTMDKGRMLAFHRKADWNTTLIPEFVEATCDCAPQAANETDDPVKRTTKRQKGNDGLSLSPENPLSMTSATVPSDCKSHRSIKTPRPDATVGLRDSAIRVALRKRGMCLSHALEFLEHLQYDQKLLSDPTQSLLSVRFPMLVVEGKGYATGSTLFGAENQAAVAGSCMINLLRQLTDLHNETASDGQPPDEMGPFAFSICTQGPLLGLWVHYAVETRGITEYHMNLLMACHTSFVFELQKFLLLVEQVMSWYRNEFLDEVADQLVSLSKHPVRS